MAVSITCSPQGDSTTQFTEKERPDYTLSHTVSASTSDEDDDCLLYTSPSPRDRTTSGMPSSA